MSKEVIKKYKAEFDHWLDEGSILCRSKANLQESWNEIKEPLWLDIYLYIINDEYVEFRKAFADGKKIEFLDTVDYSWTTWEPSVGFGSHTGGYRIKPDEPKFPCYYKEKSSGIIVYFKGDDNPNCYNLPGQYLGTVIKGNCGLQSSTGFKWRCWDTFINPDRWEHLKNYIEEPKFKVGDLVRLNDEIAKVSAVVDGIIDNLELNGKFYLPLRKDTLELWEPQPNEWCIFTSSEDPTDIALGKFTGMSGNLYVSSAVRGSSWTYCEPFIGTLPTGCTK